MDDGKPSPHLPWQASLLRTQTHVQRVCIGRVVSKNWCRSVRIEQRLQRRSYSPPFFFLVFGSPKSNFGCSNVNSSPTNSSHMRFCSLVKTSVQRSLVSFRIEMSLLKLPWRPPFAPPMAPPPNAPLSVSIRLVSSLSASARIVLMLSFWSFVSLSDACKLGSPKAR